MTEENGLVVGRLTPEASNLAQTVRVGCWLVLRPSHVSTLCIQSRAISAMFSKGKGVPVHAMKTYEGSRSTSALILNLVISWR